MNTVYISDMLHRAMREADLDGHIKVIERRSEADTWAEKIADRFREQELPVKNSYMFCDTLDMCFFYDTNLKATFTYAGYSTVGQPDIMQGKLQKAFSKAKELLLIMDRISKEAGNVK